MERDLVVEKANFTIKRQKTKNSGKLSVGKTDNE